MMLGFVLETFKPLIDFILKIEEDLPSTLKVLKYGISAEQYVARGMIISFYIFLLSLFSSIVVISILTFNPLFGTTAALIISFFLSFSFFFFYLKLPSLKVRSIENKIEKEMTHAIPLFSAFVSDKIPLEYSFKSFVDSNPTLRISKEFNEIYNITRFGGLDIVRALELKIEMTPSRKLRNFLFGLLTTIKSGASIKDYVTKSSEDEIIEYRNKIREASKKMTLFLEIYMIAIVIGSIFLLIVTSIFSLIQPIPNLLELQFFIVFVLVPIISLTLAKVLQTFIV
jgi:flagellar protein FlaJ